MAESSSSSGGIGFTGLLTIVFIVLKLTNYIDWSWWWVLSPIWIHGLIIILILGIGLIFITKKTKKPTPKPTKSKWQERLEQIQEQNKK